jgi:hypothetical protein
VQTIALFKRVLKIKKVFGAKWLRIYKYSTVIKGELKNNE